MLLDILNVLKVALSKYEKINLSEEEIRTLGEILDYYRDDLVPVSIVKRDLKLTYEQANDLMVFLAKHDILEINYKIWCDNEYLYNSGDVYRHIIDVPKDICNKCEKECQILKNVVIVFRNILNV